MHSKEFLSGYLVDTYQAPDTIQEQVWPWSLAVSTLLQQESPNSSAWAVLQELAGGLSRFFHSRLACHFSLVFAN